jgi:hypothetical protein
MPVDAKFCGFCGASLKTLEDKKLLPIWELFEPGAFIGYDQFDEDGLLSSKYWTISKVTDKIIEFFCQTCYFDEILIELRRRDEEGYYYYIGKDRRYYRHKHSKHISFEQRQSLEDLEPTKVFIDLWIDPTHLAVNDLIPIGHCLGKVVSYGEEQGRQVYIVELNDPKKILRSTLYYDSKTGLLLRSKTKTKSVNGSETITESRLNSLWTKI